MLCCSVTSSAAQFPSLPGRGSLGGCSVSCVASTEYSHSEAEACRRIDCRLGIDGFLFQTVSEMHCLTNASVMMSWC